jgi:hypothetical protein
MTLEKVKVKHYLYVVETEGTVCHVHEIFSTNTLCETRKRVFL